MLRLVRVPLALSACLTCMAGEITGKITPPGRCKEIKAVSRMMKLDYTAEVNPVTGGYAIKNLPAGRFDLVLTMGDAQIAGVDLALDPADAADDPLTDNDRKTVSKWIEDNFLLGKEFENKGRPIYIAGNGKHCKALVEKIRDKAFHQGQDQAVYRVEIWLFDKLYGTWRKRAHTEQVVVRERLPMSEYRRKAFFFDPKLGGVEVNAKGDATTLDYAIPPTLDETMGKPAETKP